MSAVDGDWVSRLLGGGDGADMQRQSLDLELERDEISSAFFARKMRIVYASFRVAGFSRREAFQLTLSNYERFIVPAPPHWPPRLFPDEGEDE